MKKISYLLLAIPSLCTAQGNQVNIWVEHDVRYITSNGIPDHTPGQFPNKHNPNQIQAQNYQFEVPASPKIAASTTSLGRHPFGIAINGIPFDPGTAEFWNNDPNSGWNYEAQSEEVHLGLDNQLAHVQPNGAYHYHGLPPHLESPQGQHPTLIGYAADGFPIYPPTGYRDPMEPKKGLKILFSSYRLKLGNRTGGPGGAYDGQFVQDYEFVQGLGDLDQCNGRFGRTPEYPDGTYYYVITRQFPYVPRCFVGTVDQSFYRDGPPEGMPRKPPPVTERAKAVKPNQSEINQPIPDARDTDNIPPARPRKPEGQMAPQEPSQKLPPPPPTPIDDENLGNAGDLPPPPRHAGPRPVHGDEAMRRPPPPPPRDGQRPPPPPSEQMPPPRPGRGLSPPPFEQD